MKFWIFAILPILPLPLAHPDEDEKVNKTTQPTGIMLDSMGNEVQLALLDGHPDHYFSNIFTPVCNTGECLPVYVNIYWDLQGNYLRFDQPEGEILTKLDHVPFTEEDYKLLDEILSSSSDPRLVAQVKHSQGSQSDQGNNQSSPAPEAVTAVKMVGKYDMVDGITGSTLPEIKDKFVPGALYTTYTLWGLARDKHYAIFDYTRDSLIVETHYEYFLTQTDYKLRNYVINKLTDDSDPEGHANVCSSLLDTGTTKVQQNIMSHFNYNEYTLDVVQNQFMKTFQETEDLYLKKMILSRFTNSHISDKNYTTLSATMSEHEDVMVGMILLFTNKFYLTDEIFNNWKNQFDKLSKEHQKILVKLLKQNKSMLYGNQKKALKKMEKQI